MRPATYRVIEKCCATCIYRGAAKSDRMVCLKLEDPPDKDEGYGEHAAFVDASQVPSYGVCEEWAGW